MTKHRHPQGHAAKAPAPFERFDRVHGTSATLDELHEQTRLLYLSITTKARQARAAARLPKYPKRIVPRRF